MHKKRIGATNRFSRISLILLSLSAPFFLKGGGGTAHTIDLLALDPGAEQASDLPEIRSPGGTGINGLYRALQQPQSGVPETPRDFRTFDNRNRMVTDSRDTNGIPRGRERPFPPGGDASAPLELLPGKEDPDASLRVEIPSPPDFRKEKTKEGVRTTRPGEKSEKNRTDQKAPTATKGDTEQSGRTIVHLQSHKTDPNPSGDAADHSARSTIGYPRDLVPTPRSGYRYDPPSFYRGIYINNLTARNSARYKELIQKGKEAGLNTLVVDVQPELPPIEFIRLARTSNFYLVGRVVVFQGGLKRYPPSMQHLQKTLDVAEQAAKSGFMEIQFDYIRFADRMEGLPVPLKNRYHLIAGILKMATDRLRPMGMHVGADVFGRIAFNRDDTIGQKLEVFAPHLDTIYPMLYPSHFYGEPAKIRNPYRTVKEGVESSQKRVGDQSRIVAYIQGFKMSVPQSGLSLTEYIRKQIEASERAGGGGFIVWNASNHYEALFRALQEQKKLSMDSREDKGP